MSDRKEYFKQYFKKNRAKHLLALKKSYLKHKRKRLTKAKKHYILNREAILAKLETQRIEFIGHAQLIYKAIRKYAKEWKLPFSSWDEFKLWTSKDEKYEELFNSWKENDFNIQFSPVVMRLVKKNGYTVGNLEWRRKGEYSWWNEDRVLRDQIEKNLDKQQKERNQRTKEWQRKTREEWKAKRKGR